MRASIVLLAAVLLTACSSPIEEKLDAASMEIEQGAYERALKIYQEVLAEGTDVPNLHNNMGYALLQLGRYEEAIQQFETAYEQGTTYGGNGPLLHNWANALEKLERYTEAEAKYAAAATADPNSSDVFINWGNTLSHLDRLAEAAERYEQGVKNDPSSAMGWFNWGYTLERLNSLEEALTCYRRFLNLNPEGPSNMVEHARRFVARAEAAGHKEDTNL